MTYLNYEGICLVKRYMCLLFVLRGKSYRLLSPGSALKFGAPGPGRVSLRENQRHFRRCCEGDWCQWRITTQLVFTHR